MPYIRVYDTRRMCASLLAALDAHRRVAKPILRHAQSNVTMAVYSQVPDDSIRDTPRRLGDQLDG